MELDELKASWQRLDHRVQELTAMNRRLMLDNTVRKTRWQLAPWIAGAVANLAIGVYFAIASGSYWASRIGSPPALIAGIAVQVMSIVFIVMGAGRLALVRRIDFTRPVLEIQRTLASMQRWEAWSFHAVWIGICLLVPIIMIAIALLTIGLRAWERVPIYFVVNMVLWVVVAVGPVLLYLWSRRRKGRIAAWMDGLLASHSIARARATLDEVEDFMRA
jgi:hypothetical protein